MPLRLWDRPLRTTSVLRAGRPPGTRAPAEAGALLEVPMRALRSVRTAPVRAAARLQVMQADRDAGMTTAEYAVGTVAACGFSGILYKVITSPEVLGLITGVIGKAFKLSF